MSKQTRREKSEEEKRIIAEIEEGTENAKKTETKKKSFYDSAQPETVHCRRCRAVMEKGVCPTCGFKMYVPMDEEKRRKIKTVTTAIGFVVFIVVFLIIQFAKNS